MIVPVVLGFYIFICISVVLFNCWKIFSGMLVRWRFRIRKRRLWRWLVQCRAGSQELSPRSRDRLLRRMSRSLRRNGRMMALHAAMDEIQQQLPRLYDDCLPVAASVVHAALPRYMGRSGMKQAYYSFLVTRFQVMKYAPGEQLTAFLLDQVREGKSLYNLENALRAIYSSNRPRLVLEALHALDGAEDVFVHEKLLVDGLLTFEDSDGLIAALWEAFPGFGSRMQQLLLDYIRFASGAWRNEMLALAQSTQDLEVKIACLRYFGRYPDKRAFPMLSTLAADANGPEWELCAVCMTALASYPGDITLALLKDGLRSRNWYVRYNAALSLRSLNADPEQLRDVLEGDDRYAREMLEYRLGVRAEDIAAARAVRDTEMRAEADWQNRRSDQSDRSAPAALPLPDRENTRKQSDKKDGKNKKAKKKLKSEKKSDQKNKSSDKKRREAPTA